MGYMECVPNKQSGCFLPKCIQNIYQNQSCNEKLLVAFSLFMVH